MPFTSRMMLYFTVVFHSVLLAGFVNASIRFSPEYVEDPATGLNMAHKLEERSSLLVLGGIFLFLIAIWHLIHARNRAAHRSAEPRLLARYTISVAWLTHSLVLLPICAAAYYEVTRAKPVTPPMTWENAQWGGLFGPLLMGADRIGRVVGPAMDALDLLLLYALMTFVGLSLLVSAVRTVLARREMRRL